MNMDVLVILQRRGVGTDFNRCGHRVSLVRFHTEPGSPGPVRAPGAVVVPEHQPPQRLAIPQRRPDAVDLRAFNDDTLEGIRA